MSTSTNTSPPAAGKTGFRLPQVGRFLRRPDHRSPYHRSRPWPHRQVHGQHQDCSNGLGATLQTIGSSYVSLLQTAVVPLIFTAVVSSIANLRQVSNAARLAWNTLLWFAITSLVSVLIGIGLGVLLQPGAATGITEEAKYAGKTGDWWAFLIGLFPKNFLGLGASSTVTESANAATTVSTAVNFNVLQILVIAIAIGVAALKVGKQAEAFLTFNASALAVIQKVLWWIIRIAPAGHHRPDR